MENVVAFQRGEGRLPEKYRCVNQIYYNNLEDPSVLEKMLMQKLMKKEDIYG